MDINPESTVSGPFEKRAPHHRQLTSEVSHLPLNTPQKASIEVVNSGQSRESRNRFAPWTDAGCLPRTQSCAPVGRHDTQNYRISLYDRLLSLL